MERSRRRKFRLVSSLSDEKLAILIEAEREKCPADFSSSKTSSISDTQLFLKNTSARGINPMKKWL